MKRSIIWFKTDLRLHDNETLIRAIAASDEVIPVYCIDERMFTVSEFGFYKTGNFRAQFLLESLVDLDKNLRALGSGLLVVRGKPEVELPGLVKRYAVQQVFAKKEVAFEEIQVQEAVEAALERYDCPLETFSTSTLYHALDLPFPLKDIPDVFTRFRKQVEGEATVRNVFAKPASIVSPRLEPIYLPTLKQLGLPPIILDARAQFVYSGGETAALERLYHYLFETKAISSYKETRNGLLGANFSSRFSAWLSLGCLSPREIHWEIKRYETLHGSNESTYWLVFELLWRDYFRFMMKKYRHRFFMQHGINSNPSTPATHNPQRFEKWVNGKTGNDFIDANMRELLHTGMMSNRGRQNVASYLCHQLKLDWRWGAAYFEQQLIDYDVCSNWGNWAYLAGVGNDPRGSRVFNIEKQADEYDKHNAYRRHWL